MSITRHKMPWHDDPMSWPRELRKPGTEVVLASEHDAEVARLRAVLRDIVSTYERRSELFTNDADLAANLRDRAARAAGSGK